MTKVIGIDTNSKGFHWVSNFGIGINIDRGELYGWCECKQDDVDERRIQTTQYAHALFEQLSMDNRIAGADSEVNIFCEEPLALQNGKTTRLLGLAAGAIFGAFVLAYPNAYWHWVDQSTWKKAILGRGVKPKDFVGQGPKAKWEKEWIRSMVIETPGFLIDNAVEQDDYDAHADLYDAWAIRTYGVRTLARM